MGQDGTKALVVPDLKKMALVNAGTVSPDNQGKVDLAQATVAYQALINALSNGGTVSAAVDAANAAISSWYSPTNYTSIGKAVLPRVIYKPVGNSALCVRSCEQ